jgi:O-antigen/teichoic acid export membrane protein
MKSRNLAFGVINSAVSAAVAIAVVPMYLKYFGVALYGILSFFFTVRTILLLLDLGASQTLSRAAAQARAVHDYDEVRRLSGSVTILFLMIGVVLTTVIWLASPHVARSWFVESNLDHRTIETSFLLIGATVLFRLFVGLYQGALLGLERQALTSVVNSVSLIVGDVGGLLVVAKYAPRLELFLAWQLVVAFLHAMALFYFSSQMIGSVSFAGLTKDVLKGVVRYSLGVGSINALGMLLVNLDKIVLSRVLTLDVYGVYMLGVMFASSVQLLVLPVFNNLSPRFVALLQADRIEEAHALFRRASIYLSLGLFSFALFINISVEPVLLIWTGDAALVARAAPVVGILVVANAIHGLTYMPYAIALAKGVVSPFVQLHLGLVLISVPCTLVLASGWGAAGAAVSQLILFLSYSIYGSRIAGMQVFRFSDNRWFIEVVLIPVLIVAVSKLTIQFSVEMNAMSAPVQLLFGSLVVAVAGSFVYGMLRKKGILP